MREIKFRGKRIDNKEWVYGNLVFHYENQRKFILCDQMAYTYTECGIGRIVSEHYFEVIPETIGQYTGIKDTHNKEIYEGDIVNARGGEYYHGVWEWYTVQYIKDIRYSLQPIECFEYIEIVGNIYDNPEWVEEVKGEL